MFVEYDYFFYNFKEITTFYLVRDKPKNLNIKHISSIFQK